MKNIFVDTNIIVDLLGDRQPFSKYAIELFKKAEEGTLRLYTSSHSMATTYYLLKKHLDDKTLREVLLNLMDFLTIIPVDADVLKKALRSRYNDVEDAVQIGCAATVKKMDGIITRNIKDFKGSEIPVFAPDEFHQNQN
jgi:predicted nucleic acid-binding protein